VQVLVDAADNAAAGSVLSYLGQIQGRATERILGRAPREPVELRTRFLFNPELNSKWFVVPGLIVVIMSILAVLLTALTVAREWESGSMELLLSTPVRPLEIILGKLAPYAGLCLIAVGIVYALARVVFHVPFAGNPFVFLLGCLLFIVTYLAQGLLISVLTRKQTFAMQMAMMSGLLPSQLLSGFIFPIESMPAFFRGLTMILPARWFMAIVRDSFLQGASLWDMRGSFLALGIIGAALIALASRKFKKDLEL
jgi:ABC-2 type transport system permease protein